jgi:5-methylcytosine-specific restriction endonuclease McrA
VVDDPEPDPRLQLATPSRPRPLTYEELAQGKVNQGRKPNNPRNAWYFLRGRPGSRHVPRALAAAIKARDGWVCLRCGEDDPAKLRIDHIYPYAWGGKTVSRNLQTLCAYCNGQKSDLFVLDFRPRRRKTQRAR